MPRARMGFVSLALLLALFGRSVAQEAPAPAKAKPEAKAKAGTKKAPAAPGAMRRGPTWGVGSPT